MRRGRGAGLAGLAAVLLVAAGRAQVQQEPSAETNEGTGVTINCSHPNIQSNDYIYWFRQLPGRAPAFLAFTVKGSRDLQAPPGRLSVAADRRSSALWLARPRRGDAAVYYCAMRWSSSWGLAHSASPARAETQWHRHLLSFTWFLLIISASVAPVPRRNSSVLIELRTSGEDVKNPDLPDGPAVAVQMSRVGSSSSVIRQAMSRKAGGTPEKWWMCLGPQ
ncbi:uncharacterized protein LOC141934288 [Strix aluco]|uniref:uncharacterized protein LOC141934288 n=1 Tax=Strix aluco TaxID=111821 RepID=UPI003DA1D36D